MGSDGRWIKAAGWDKALNRQGTTWRKLDDATKASVTDAESARAVMASHASVIKRPTPLASSDSSFVFYQNAAGLWL